MKNGKLVGGVIAGLATGAVLGLLFAPAKGSATRRRILGKSPRTSPESPISLHDVMRKNKEHLQHHNEQQF